MEKFELHVVYGGQKILVQRRNILTEGYLPIRNEIIGIISLIKGIFFSVFTTDEPFMTSRDREMQVKGRALIKDGIINIGCSPMSFFISRMLINKLQRKILPKLSIMFFNWFTLKSRVLSIKY